MNAQEIIDRLASQLKDPNHTRWTLPDLIRYISDGQRQVCLLRPDAFSLNEIVKLAVGTKQTVPADSHVFQRAVMNWGDDGATAGNAITPALIPDLDQYDPTWRTSSGATGVEHSLFDYNQPTVYWIYPGVPVGANVYAEIQTGKVPSEVLDLNEALEISDVYLPSLYYYGMFRSLSRNDDTANQTEADRYEARFMRSLGLKLAADKEQRTRIREGAG